ncbi:type VI secretion system Vgr family protein [Chondromyces apiculatus]|uniref:VgrG protein n=1 Tax=Chondromyces apiculatus DSM 436 TaxID=1192034 RepID=A0A017T774_9BACT|nr:type VI secretion system tip protein TssI/VgrG [Chondromyces apiculatus]EYF05093.1 VgrG protein [Chondromyces apiculatus DSM 436]
MSHVDFTFACEGVGSPAEPWAALEVVRFQGREALSALYRYEIVLLARAQPVDVDALVGKRASLRIATGSTPAWKVVHGLVTEAEEIASLPEGRTLRVLLSPPLARATHRRRCRIFLDKTLRQIVDAVLLGDPLLTKGGGESPEPDLGDPDFTPAEEAFAWRIEDASRLDSKRVRPFVVQYNESDFAFVARLLEEEGIAFHVENGAGKSLLVLSDGDAGRPRLSPLLASAAIAGREIRGFFAGARLRPEAVSLGDYNWKQPDVAMATQAGAPGADLFEQVYPGGYPDEAGQGKLLAGALLDRHRTEARFARGEGTLRVLSAGTIFRLEHSKSRLEGEYLVTALEVRGEQSGVLQSTTDASMGVPFDARFTCARRGEGTAVQESRFRPPRTTPKPRIQGTQTAVVTAEPSARGAEINVGGPDGLAIGAVRVRFHWDTDEERLASEPSSLWVRVSQSFAGSGMGGVWHARVGTEVIVAFEEGDPDRPIVVGRVYNGQNQPHRGGSPSVSTFKSNSSPGGAVHNEITFDDSAGAELVYTCAGKDMETDVGNDRTETVAADASMTVGGDDTETIGGSCSVTVGGNETVTVGANDTALIGANCTTTIGANSMTTIGGSEAHIVGANQSIAIGATHTEHVGGSVTEAIGASLTTTVASSETEEIGANRATTIAGAHTQTFGAAHLKQVGGNRSLECADLTTEVGAASIRIVGGSITTEVGGSHTLSAGGGAIYLTPRYSASDDNRSDINDAKITVVGLNMTFGLIQLAANGLNTSTLGVSLAATGLNLEFSGAQLDVFAILTRIHGGHVETAGFKGRFGQIIKL